MPARRRARIVMLDLDSWDGLGEWGSSLRTAGLPVIRVVRSHRRRAYARRWLDRWQFGAFPVEVSGCPGDDPHVRAALAPPTVDVQGPEAELRDLERHLPAQSRARDLLRRVPESVGQETLYDKWRMTRLALASGLHVPDSWDRAREDALPVVVKGRISAGGQDVEIVGLAPTQKTTVTGIEMFRKELDQGEAGDNAGILLRGTKREDVERGQVMAKPGTITPHTDFECECYILNKEEGGRHTPFFSNYRPQFYFRTTDVTGSVELPAGVEMVMPGDNIKMTVKLGAPIAMDEGLRFAIREGGRTVGAGVVGKIIK